MNQLSASNALIDGKIIGPTRVTWNDNGVITNVQTIALSDVDEWATIVPGFIDIQVNGIDNFNVADAKGDDWKQLDRHLLDSGVTSWCPTLVSAPLSSIGTSLEAVTARIHQDVAENVNVTTSVLGAHLEGPFLGEVHGAHRPSNIMPIDLDWIEHLPSCVRLMTLGAEQVIAVDAIVALRKRNISVAIGHSRASDEQFKSATTAGAMIVTHLFNAMSGVHHRQNGLALFALTSDELFASIIVDLEHVSARAVQLAFRAKPHKMILITDSVRSTGTTAPRLEDGTLAGSVLTMERAIRNAVTKCSVPLVEALNAASINPANALGIHDRGQIEIGKRADLVVLSTSLHVTKTISNGRVHSINSD
jgi:N-acetylglucosamine-6-phosphate deacetylase